MNDATIHDDARDAIALIRTYLDDDDQAAGIIHDNCDPHGVLAIMTSIAAEGLIRGNGKDGAREWLNRIQRRIQRQDDAQW